MIQGKCLFNLHLLDQSSCPSSWNSLLILFLGFLLFIHNPNIDLTLNLPVNKRAVETWRICFENDFTTVTMCRWNLLYCKCCTIYGSKECEMRSFIYWWIEQLANNRQCWNLTGWFKDLMCFLLEDEKLSVFWRMRSGGRLTCWSWLWRPSWAGQPRRIFPGRSWLCSKQWRSWLCERTEMPPYSVLWHWAPPPSEHMGEKQNVNR